MHPLLPKRWLLFVLFVIFTPFLWEEPSLGWDLSSSDRSGRYPWEEIPVYEEVAIVKLPSRRFNEDFMALISNTPLAEAFTVPMEMRPMLVASVAGHLLEGGAVSHWTPIKGEPNPILMPLYAALLEAFSSDAAASMTLVGELASYPLMMPDSAGSAVLELGNATFEAPFLDRTPLYAVMFPFKVGFWVEGDYLHVDILNPEALAGLVVKDEEESIRRDLLAVAHEARQVLVESMWEVLSGMFDSENLLFHRVPLPPYRGSWEVSSSPALVSIGSVRSDLELLDVAQGLLNATIPGSPFEMRFFQTYAAFDGISGLLEGALANPSDMSAWVPTPDGQVADDVMYLNGITASEELPFIRAILTPMFKQTFLVPRGSSFISYHTSQGNEVLLIDVGSPYFGQILLRMGGHRAPGTPCKIILYKDGDVTHLAAIDPSFMFEALFGDTHPEEIRQWDGAFEWPYGVGLETLGQEARGLFVAYAAMALSEMGGGLDVELSQAAQQAVQEVFGGVP